MAMTYHLDVVSAENRCFPARCRRSVTGSEGELGIFPAMRRC